jgi:hypothetical protein
LEQSRDLVLGVWLGSLLWWAGLALGAGAVRLSFGRHHLVWINRARAGYWRCAGSRCLAACCCSIWVEVPAIERSRNWSICRPPLPKPAAKS